MKLTIDKQIATLTPRKSVVKAYRADPANLTKAAYAAHHYAKKNNENMVLIPGNSYMHKVYHIAKTTDDITKYAPGATKISVTIVTVDGKVFQAIATK